MVVVKLGADLTLVYEDFESPHPAVCRACRVPRSSGRLPVASSLVYPVSQHYDSAASPSLGVISEFDRRREDPGNDVSELFPGMFPDQRAETIIA